MYGVSNENNFRQRVHREMHERHQEVSFGAERSFIEYETIKHQVRRYYVRMRAGGEVNTPVCWVVGVLDDSPLVEACCDLVRPPSSHTMRRADEV